MSHALEAGYYNLHLNILQSGFLDDFQDICNLFAVLQSPLSRNFNACINSPSRIRLEQEDNKNIIISI